MSMNDYGSDINSEGVFIISTDPSINYIDPRIQPDNNIYTARQVVDKSADLTALVSAGSGSVPGSAVIYGGSGSVPLSVERDAARAQASAGEIALQARIAAEKASQYAASLATKAAAIVGTPAGSADISGPSSGSITGIGVGTDINIQSQGFVAKSTAAVNKVMDTDPQSFYIAGAVAVIGILALIFKK